MGACAEKRTSRSSDLKTTVLAITLGDPAGIGPEVALKAAHTARPCVGARLVFVGANAVVRDQASYLGMRPPPPWRPAMGRPGPALVCWEPGPDDGPFERVSASLRPGKTGLSAGRAAATWIRAAVHGCMCGWFQAMVTGPICKKSLALAGVRFPGHTEYLAHLTGVRHPEMMLLGDGLRVVLVTRHLPLAQVPGAISVAAVVRAARAAHLASAWLGLKNRTIAVCALNPHAGEGGALGAEELRVIKPALRLLRRAGVKVEGPVPADVAFHHARRGRYGVVIAMYHDQGLGPLKTVAFDSGVNLTLGLPLVRTSPDHGTAFDIAGRGIADPSSMLAAIRLALRLAARRNPWADEGPSARRAACRGVFT